MANSEKHYTGTVINGFFILFLNLALFGGAIFFLILGIDSKSVGIIVPAIALLIIAFFIWAGFLQLEPNEAKVMVFFGEYKGSFKKTGFYWVNPFIAQKKLSLRSRNLDIKPIKVNDQTGNPILIGMVLVWKLSDTYKALFEIDSQTLAQNGNGAAMANVSKRMQAFEGFVTIQADAALRKVAGEYAYDNNIGKSHDIPDNQATLRDGGDEINGKLVHELNERLKMAGIEVVEARLNYLAYAPEIAAVMLRRQQADAIIAAREKIVEGAVSMVKMAIDKLENKKVVNLSDDKKSTLVSNLLVVLCADEAAQPVINTGHES